MVLDSVAPLGTERTALLDAIGRVLGEDVVSTRDVPGYDNSAMDGYAVRHDDVAELPATLEVVGIAAAGGKAPRIGTGQAARIMTGGAIPEGADTIIKVEDTTPRDNSVQIDRGGERGRHIRHPGEDVRVGETVLARGRELTPADAGVLASLGRTLVLVHRRPRVAIVSTGDELVEADREVRPGQIVNSNAYALAAAVTEAGGLPVALPIARDTPAAIRAALEEAAGFDAVLSTGGVSVGEYDYVKAVMDELGIERRFWRVAQKPGKPVTFGMLGRRPWFGLPGNPVSSLVCFYLYARPALRRLAGAKAVHLPIAEATVAEDVPKAASLLELIRCRFGLDGRVHPTGTQSSGVPPLDVARRWSDPRPSRSGTPRLRSERPGDAPAGQARLGGPARRARRGRIAKAAPGIEPG